MKAALLICPLLFGCAVSKSRLLPVPLLPVVFPPAPPMVHAQARTLPEVVAGGAVLHIGFADADNNYCMDDQWTNDWSFSALVSFDASAPLSQWQELFPALEMYNGFLTFGLVENGPQLFCRGKFQPIPQP